MQNNPFAKLRAISARLAFLERLVCLTSGLSLSCAILIAGATTTFLGRVIPGLGILQFLWAMFTVLAIDTQLWAAIGAQRDAFLAKHIGAAIGWGIVLLFLLPPAFLVNLIFGLDAAGIVHTESQAVHILGITPVIWIVQRCFYGVVLMVISGYTRPWAEEKIQEQPIVPEVLRLPDRKRKNTRRASTNVQGRRKRTETAMTLWREEQAARLYREKPSITMRELARNLVYEDTTTGRSFACSPETAGRILRPLRASSAATEGIAA